MRVRLFAACLVCGCVVATAQQRQPAPPPRPAPPASLIEKLYRLVWPAGRFTGNLVRAVSEASQKGSTALSYSQLFVVDSAQRSAKPWAGSSGASDPVVCMRSQELYYRRGTKAVRELLRVEDGRVRSAGEPLVLEGATVNALFGCASSAEGAVLWVQSPDGSTKRLLPRERGVVEDTARLDAEVDSADASEIADILRIVHGLRPDGLVASASNGSVIGTPASGATFRMVETRVRFSGFPAWVPGTDALFVTGENQP